MTRLGPLRWAALLVAAALLANVLATTLAAPGSAWRVALGVAQAPLLVAAIGLVVAARRERPRRGGTGEKAHRDRGPGAP